MFLLRESNLVKKMKQQNNLRKSDENDAYILSLIPREFFRELNSRDLQLRRLINNYMMIDREVTRLKSKMKNEYRDYKDIKKCVKEFIKMLEDVKERIGEEICKAVKDDVLYKRVLDYFGYQKSPLIAMLLLKIDFSKGTHKIFDYLGLHAKAEKYNHTVRAVLSKIANNIYVNALRSQNSSTPIKYVEVTRNYPRRKASLKIQTEIIRDIRKIWREVNQQILATR